MKLLIFVILVIGMTACKQGRQNADADDGGNELSNQQDHSVCKMTLNSGPSLEDVLIYSYKLKTCGKTEDQVVFSIK
jgi:hypothetical protein